MSEIAATEKTLKTRLKMKYLSTEDQANTEKTSATLLQGELAIYGGDKPKMKVGDDEATIADLPFIGSDGDLTVDLEGVTNGTITLTNADLLNGVPASDYVLKEELENYASQDELTYCLNSSLTLLASDWIQNGSFYTQNFSLEGVSSNDKPIVDIDLSNAEMTDYENLEEQWSFVKRVVSGDNSITFYCGETIPTVDLIINVQFVISRFTPT